MTLDFRTEALMQKHLADARINVELETEGMVLNLGPSTLPPTAPSGSSSSSTASGSSPPTRSSATCTGATRSSPSSGRTPRSRR